MVLVSQAEVERGPASDRWSRPAAGTSCASTRPIRVGIVNIMPRAETYEPYLLRPLERVLLPVEPVWIRLASHQYASSDITRIRSSYVTFEEALNEKGLDALVLTGAPVEELPFEQVHYWPELSELLRFCSRNVTSTLGLCWGGLALAKQLGLEKHSFPKKLFGVFQNRYLSPEHVITGGSDDAFWCAHSRHSGVPDRELEAARDAGVVSLLSHGADTGYTLFESVDHRFVMHLGHPEYEASRLVHEWERDTSLGRVDVEPPRNFDPRQPQNNWRSHCNELFSQWLRFVDQARARTA
jgi:homoserine O-succinyltransferase/O-acetyltransferase